MTESGNRVPGPIAFASSQAMIAVDKNILVYAHRAESAFHTVAYACVQGLAEGANRHKTSSCTIES